MPASRRQHVVVAHASEKECVENVGRLVDEAALKFIERAGVGIVRAVGGHKETRGGGDTTERIVRPALPKLGTNLDGTLTLGDMCGLVPDLMKARLVAVIKQSGARFGLPPAERAAKLADLDAKIAAAEDSHTALVDSAKDAGIDLPLLGEVKAARDRAAQVAEREAEVEAQSARGVYVVDGAPTSFVAKGAVGG